jgi:hypothetical protein
MIFGGLKVKDAPATAEKADKKELKKAAPQPAPKVDVSQEHPLAKGFRSLGRVDLALLTGQFTRDNSAGIDVLIVGNVTDAKVDKFMADLEKAENKELRYTSLPLDNYQYRLQINDRFISSVLGAKKQVIINTQDLKV